MAEQGVNDRLGNDDRAGGQWQSKGSMTDYGTMTEQGVNGRAWNDDRAGGKWQSKGSMTD